MQNDSQAGDKLLLMWELSCNDGRMSFCSLPCVATHCRGTPDARFVLLLDCDDNAFSYIVHFLLSTGACVTHSPQWPVLNALACMKETMKHKRNHEACLVSRVKEGQ